MVGVEKCDERKSCAERCRTNDRQQRQNNGVESLNSPFPTPYLGRPENRASGRKAAPRSRGGAQRPAEQKFFKGKIAALAPLKQPPHETPERRQTHENPNKSRVSVLPRQPQLPATPSWSQKRKLNFFIFVVDNHLTHLQSDEKKCYNPHCLKGSSDQNYSLRGFEDILTARRGAERGNQKLG